MNITRVTTQVRDVIEAAEFFESVLELGVERTPGAIVVKIGATLLELVENPETEGDHHFAITIPSNKFAEAKAWIVGRTTLLGTNETDEFECSAAWNARSVYFSGPDGSVLELILRRDLNNHTAGPFTSDDLLSVSEVGIASPDVLATAAFLDDEAGLSSYGGEPEGDFSPVGDIDGLLILVSPGRAWFPTDDRHASTSPMTIEATGPRTGTFPLGAGSTLRIRQ